MSVPKGRILKGYENRKKPYIQRFWESQVYKLRYGIQMAKKIGQKNVEYFASFRPVWKQYGFHPLTEVKNFDIVVVGSDEVFNCCQRSLYGFSSALYGDIPNAKYVISYAGSFGHTTLSQLQTCNIDKEIGTYLSSMQAVSVRDQNSLDIVKNLTGKEPLMHIDPVLAYGYKNEIKELEPIGGEQYLIVYSYPRRIKNTKEIKAIKEYARKNNLKIVGIMGFYPWCDANIVPKDPFETLRWFKSASCIITDTFHGTIFSTITHRPFVTIIRKSNRNKLSHLLALLGLSGRALDNPSMLGKVIDIPIDYDKVEYTLSPYRDSALSYLKTNLNK